MSNNVSFTMTHDGMSFNVTPKQGQILEILMDTNGGGFARINGYHSKTTDEISNITFISRFRYDRLLERKKNFLKDVSLENIMDKLRDNPKIKQLPTESLHEAFEARKKALLESIIKTESGERTDAHRQAHDRNYHVLVPGVKVHFATHKVDGKEVPILDNNGNPTVDSILLNIIQVEKEIVKPGVYKEVNSGVPVLISNAIESIMPKTCKMKSLNLNEGNFESISIAGNKFGQDWQEI